MPELPELVVMREVLESNVLGRQIASARAYRPGILKTVEPGLDRLPDSSFMSVSRRGKHLILTCGDDLHLVIHLMRAGRLVLCGADTKVTRATGFVVRFADGEDLRVVENGKVKMVKVHLVQDPSDVPWISGAGVEPLSEAFTVEYLVSSFAGLRRQVKKALTDQTIVAGIGTAYADEILFAARTSPIRYVCALSREEIERLHAETIRVLSEAIGEIRTRFAGSMLAESVRDFLKIYKRGGMPCPVCGTPIAEIRYAQTRTYYCPTCQASGETLRDRRSWMTK